MYAARTDPAMVAIPDVMMECNSLSVILGRNDLIINGASIPPIKMLAVELRVSAADVPMTIAKMYPILVTKNSTMPR